MSLARLPQRNQSTILRAAKRPAPPRWYHSARPKKPLTRDASTRKQSEEAGKMNLGSQNMGIPGLALLRNMAPTHPATAAPFISAARDAPEQAPPLTPRYVPPKKNKALMRKLAEAEARVSSQAPRFRPQREPSQRSTSNDGRQAPSKESGGIPDPTPLYLAQSLSPPQRLASPRRILVIMDLNGTLLYRPNKRNPFNFIERPNARQFLSYCIDTFRVAIWSSARPQNVNKMVAQLLTPRQRARCVVIWARDRFGLSPADYDARVQCYKRLTTLWSDPAVAASHPAAARGERWDQTNTVLVDDSFEKARSEPHNLLEIPEFSGMPTEPADVLPQVHDYLNLLCYQADVSRYMRQTPFKLNPNYVMEPYPPIN